MSKEIKNNELKKDEIRFISDKKTDPIEFVSPPKKSKRPQSGITGGLLIEDWDKAGAL